MPKKEGSNKTFRISKLVYIIIFLVLLISSFLLLEQERTVKIKDTITEYFENGDILTWEVKYSPEEIYKQNYPSLYQNKETEAFKETLHESLVYYPYLLLDVKYLKNNKTY